MTTNVKPDRESLIALEALLKIRTESMDNTTTQISATNAVTNPTTGMPVMISPTYSLSAVSAALAPRQRPMQAVHGMISAVANQYNHVLVQNPTVPVAVQPMMSRTFPETKNAQSKKRKTTESPTAAPLHSQEDEEKSEVIRKDQIQAALKSKPQRGRKRENLSVLERLELTRTRNREHAKSTRIRKKARYQELVDKEEKYEAMKKTADLADEQRGVMSIMVSALQAMLNDSSASHKYNSLDPLLEKKELFEFRVNAIQHMSIPSAVDAWKTEIFESISAISDNPDLVSVELQVSGGSDGVAVSKNGACFADIMCMVSHNNQTFTLMESSLRIQFAPDSDKIKTAHWITLVNHTSAAQRRSSGASVDASEELRCQTSYPSVVSLDPAQPSPDSRQSNYNEGPGMHI